MPTSNVLEIMLNHDRWGTRQILDACVALTPDQFGQKFEIGPGSLQATVTHILAAQRTWSDTLAVRAHRPRLDEGERKYTPAELMALLDEIASEFGALVQGHPLEEMVTRTRPDGQTITLTRGAIAAHVTTHAMHHRAQCLNMLRQLGVKPLPRVSVVEWTFLADGK
jgi:uncharacterized damage-inducible protein DinB